MDRETCLRIFATDEAIPEARRLSAGGLSVVISGGAVRALHWHGTEVLRGVDYPIRDSDWGTFAGQTIEERINEDGGGFRYTRDFAVADGALSGRFTCAGSANGRLKLRLQLDAKTDLQVNRAGFVILHPVAGVAGSPLRVTHSDGSVEETQFPELISPSQPVFDIAALRQHANGVTAEILFAGEVFEMEDQRNWSDASYKTYCRPLSLPYPYDVKAGTVIEQSVSIVLSGAGRSGADADEDGFRIGAALGTVLPEMGLAVEPGWEAEATWVHELRPGFTLLRLDLTTAEWRAKLPSLLASVAGSLDIEAIVPDSAEAIGPALSQLREALDERPVRSLTPLPKAYLKSYQPQAQWPTEASPEQAIAVARGIFQGVPVGGGMLSNFTELNRYRRVVDAGDFITHGTTAIVHAADDLSVMQTLEALPQILASAQALAPDRPYRLGLVSIGMRSNPYGAAIADNPQGVRRPMAMHDPRQRGLFGAAWMVGAVAATAGTKVQGLALAATAGPLGLIGNGEVHPAYHVFGGLCRLAGKERLSVQCPADMAAIAVEDNGSIGLLLANLGAEDREVSLPGSGTFVLLEGDTSSPDWLSRAERKKGSQVVLGPYGVAFVSLGSHDFFGPEPS